MKTRILIDGFCLIPENGSGIAHFTAGLLRALHKSDATHEYQIEVLLPLNSRNALRRHGIGDFPVRRIWLPGKIVQILSKFNLFIFPDLFLGKGIYVFPNYRNWKLARSKSLTFILDLGYMKYPETLAPRNLRYLQKNMTTWAGRADRLITISEFVKKEMLEDLNIREDKISIVNCGVDGNVFRKLNKEEVNKTINKYGVTYEGYIIYVGNLEPRKNLLALLEAYESMVTNNNLGLHLLLVGGDGWRNAELIEKINELSAKGLKIIRPKERVSDQELPYLISGARLLTHPALYEGFGLPPLQAMACETLVVCADNSSLPEVCGKGAIYVNATSTRSIEKGLLQAASIDKSDKERHIMEGKKQAGRYSWDNSAKQMIQAIDEISKPQEPINNDRIER